MPQLNWKIDVGHLITIIVLVAGGLVAFGRITADLEYLKAQVSAVNPLSARVIRVETLVEGHIATDQVMRKADCR